MRINCALDQFYLLCAELQLWTFVFYLPLEQMPRDGLLQMYDLACTVAELTNRLDEQERFTKSAPGSVLIYLQLVCFTILKLSRANHLHGDLDLQAGRRAYLGLIQMHKRLFVLTDDAWSRATGILTQLWTSKNVFRRRDDTYDSLSLRCRNRLGMGVVHDTWWWWRHEFAGFPDPYEPAQFDTNLSSFADIDPTLNGSLVYDGLFFDWPMDCVSPNSLMHF